MPQKLFKIYGDIITLRLTATESDGKFVVFETDVAPEINHGPPLHTHTDADEVTYVIAGKLSFRIGGDEVLATAGTTLYIPRNVSHTYRNLLPEPAKLLAVLTPGGIEVLLKEMSDNPGSLIANPRIMLFDNFHSLTPLSGQKGDAHASR